MDKDTKKSAINRNSAYYFSHLQQIVKSWFPCKSKSFYLQFPSIPSIKNAWRNENMRNKRLIPERQNRRD